MSGLDLTALILVAATALLIAHHHLGYPVILRLWAARRRADAVEPDAPAPQDWPSVEVIVPAYNEAAVVAEKIRNLAALDYPAEKLSIVLALDGCADDTEARARAALQALERPSKIEIRAAARNCGKIAVLNREIAASAADIVALSDASAAVGPDALLQAARRFGDPQIGVVCGAYRLREAGSAGEAAYWRYQSQVKADEAAVAAPMGAHGAFYLFRRRLWRPLPPDVINDDFVLPMRIVAEGARAVMEPSIVATELERTESRQEFWRRKRIGAGNMQQLLQCWTLADPRRGALAFVFLSGKAMRPLIPFFALLGAAATAWLAWRGYGAAQAVFALGAAASLLGALAAAWPAWGWPKPLRLIGYVLVSYGASFLGAIEFLTSGRLGRWSAPQAAAGGVSGKAAKK